MKKSTVWDPKLFKEHYESNTRKNITSGPSEIRKLKFYLDELRLKPSDIILDAGCGYGRLSIEVRDKVSKIIGIDINAENISFSKQYVGEKFEGHVVDLSLGKLPFADKYFNKIMIDNVLMFLNEDNQRNFFKEAKRILADDGVVVFNFENADYFLSSFSKMFAFLYKSKAVLQGKASHIHFQGTLSFYMNYLSQIGFKKINSIGDTYYRKMGIGFIEILPKFIHNYIVKLDAKHYNKDGKIKMASITVAASL